MIFPRIYFSIILFQIEFLMNNVYDITHLDNLCFSDKNIIYI